MRITCPNCAAQYEVPTLRLPLDRKVRCARCSTEWRVASERETIEPAREPFHPVLRPAVPAAAERTPPAPSRLRWGPKLGWAVSIMVLALVCAAVFHWRAEVVRVWPASGRILATAGSGHSTAGSGSSNRIQNEKAP